MGLSFATPTHPLTPMGFAPLGSHIHGANEKGGAKGPTNPMQQIS